MNSSRIWIRMRTASCAALAIALGAAASLSNGQVAFSTQSSSFIHPAGASFRNLLQPGFRRSDVAILTHELGLDQSQQAVVELLIDDHVKAMDEAARPLREALRRSSPIAAQVANLAERLPDQLAQDLPEMIGKAMDREPEVMEFTTEDGNRMVIVRRGGMEGDGPLPPIDPATGEPIQGEFDEDVVVHGEPGGEGSMVFATKVAVRVAGPGGAELSEERRNEIEALLRKRLEERLERWKHNLIAPAPDGVESEDEATPPPTPEEVVKLARAYLAEREVAEDLLVQDIATMLADSQQPQLDNALRVLRRIHAMPRGRLSGEQVDLNRLAADVFAGAHVPQEIQTLLDQYSEAIDAALIARDDYLSRSDIDLYEAGHGIGPDDTSAIHDGRALRRVAVRSINEQYLESIATPLDKEMAESLRSSFEKKAFRRVFRPTQTQRALEAALKLEDLEESVAESIRTIQAGYQAEMDAANARLVQLLREHEPNREAKQAEMIAAMRQVEAAVSRGEAPDLEADPIFKAFSERSTIGRRYLDQLKGMLTPEQFASLPKSSPRMRIIDGPGPMVIPLGQ